MVTKSQKQKQLEEEIDESKIVEGQIKYVINLMKLARESQKQKDKKMFKEMIEELEKGFNSNLDDKMNFDGIPLQYKVFLLQIVEQFKRKLLQRLEGEE